MKTFRSVKLELFLKHNTCYQFFPVIDKMPYCLRSNAVDKLFFFVFFSCWGKFRKAKSYLNDFWVGMIKVGRDHLVFEALKSAVS